MSISIAVTIVVVLALASTDNAANLGFTQLRNASGLSFRLLDGNSLVASIPEKPSRDASHPTDTRENHSNRVTYEIFNGDDVEVTTPKQDDMKSVLENCTSRSIDDFPEVFTWKQRSQGVVILHVFFGLYCFILTAFVCNDYLLPTLDIICARLKISTDVAGATFLATASCFPELFVNVVGTFLTQSDLGVGTVMGSAVFNTFVTPACGALSANQVIPLKWRILTRDTIIYVISVATLVIVMWDGLIVLYEAILLIVLFAGYLTMLFCGKWFACWYDKLAHLCTRNRNTVFVKNETPENKEESISNGLYRPYFHGELVAEYRKSVRSNGSREASAQNGVKAQNHIQQIEQQEEEYTEPDTPFVWPRGNRLAKIWFCFVWPLRLILFVTIPDSRYKQWRNWYLMTFVMCVIWIAISSYLSSWMTTVLGDTIGIPDSVMGITFLAAGGNMPELVSIVILSKQGNGDMAMSNTLGANTLDILLCLGLPWLIKILKDQKDIKIVSGALRYSVLSIIVCVIAFYVVTALCKYRLNNKVSLICLILYVIFLIFALLFELNVFFPVNLSMC